MPDAHEQLVREVVLVTGTSPPALYEPDSPVLVDDVTSGVADVYLIGLIGGKDVGKTALASALAGVVLGTESNFGPGTEIATAYCHASRAQSVETLLSREAGAGQFKIVTHTHAGLEKQAFLDLPDIDSHFLPHVELTRRLLRHMLFPVWVQSVEKYADLRPQQLLAKVSAGNDARNFLFVLSKIDQVVTREGEPAALELRDDYAARLGRTLSLDTPPRVFMTATPIPEKYDLASLRQLLSRQKSDDAVAGARALASAQRDRSLVAWLDAQHLPERAAKLQTIEDDALDLLNERVVAPLVESELPKLTDDPAGRGALVDASVSLRVSRWPIVPLVHTLLSPILSVVRANTSASPGSQTSVDALVGTHFTIDGQPVARATQSAFALLRQAHPDLAELYDRAKLWESLPSDVASAKLQRDLVGAVERMRDEVRTRIVGKSGVFAPVVRILLTIGVALWFPIVQPVLELAVNGVSLPAASDWVKFFVPVLGADHLLRSAAMLLIWFLALYLWIRRDTQKRVDRALSKPASGPTLADVVSAWATDLLDPIRARRERIEDLVRRANEIKRK